MYKFDPNKKRFNSEANHFEGNYQSKYIFSNQSKFVGNIKPQFSKDQPILSVEDALNELKWKQNPNIKKLDAKMYDELEKFDRIVNFMVDSHLDKSQGVQLFIEICKTFSSKQLSESTNEMKKSSIYSIFFNDRKFKLSDHFHDAVLEIIQGNI